MEIFAKPKLTIQSNTTITKGESYSLTFLLTEDNGQIPINEAVIKVYIDGVHQTRLITDEQGYAHFQSTFPNRADAVKISAIYSGSKNEFYTETDNELTLKPTEIENVRNYSLVSQIWSLVLGILAIIIIAFLWIKWRQRHIPEVKELLTDLMERLESSDKSRRIIYDAYLKLLTILERYGFIRKDSETPREFEQAIQTALPKVNSKHLDSLTSLFEEARYSKHRLGKSKRGQAVRNLRVIRKSLDA